MISPDRRAEMVGEFVDHYTASQTREEVDRYLGGLSTLAGRPLSDQIEEKP